MADRFLVALCVTLLGGGPAVACTNTIIEQKAAPAPEAGVPDPDPPEPEPDAGTTSEPPFVFKPAPSGTFAQAVSAGGSVIKSPKVVPILYAADSQKQIITDFNTKLATSSYWASVSAQYGVGPLTIKTPIILTETAPPSIDESQIESWLVSRFTSDPARFGAPDSNTLYAIDYPSGTTVTEGGGTGCTDFGGYHFETSVYGVPIGYAVMPRCAAFSGLGGSDVTTYAASHEILEWATDPFPNSNPAFMAVDDDQAVWGRVFLGELGDLCVQLGDVSVVPADLGFKVQRTWSNTSAAAGHHPCAPTTKDPYFTAFPTKPETISVRDMFGRQITTRGFKVGVGQSKTIDLTLYSDAEAGSWSIDVLDITKIYGVAPEFLYKLDKTRGRAGDTLQLTITGDKAATQGQGFLIISTTKTSETVYPVWVTN